MQNSTIAVIGCGNLGLSIVHGLLSADRGNTIIATRRNTESLALLKEKGVTVTSDNLKACESADLILIAVKPYNVAAILKEIQPVLSNQTVISLATGIKIKDIKDITGPSLPVFRAMPNTATDVQESVTCLCGEGSDDLKHSISNLFTEIGEAIWINEELMDSATILGACGIAYTLRFIRAMIQGGIEIGFDSATAGAIVNQTVKGAAELLISNKQHPEFEIDKVTTPKGCTIVGLNEMEHNGFSSSLIKGIVTSHNKIND